MKKNIPQYYIKIFQIFHTTHFQLDTNQSVRKTMLLEDASRNLMHN